MRHRRASIAWVRAARPRAVWVLTDPQEIPIAAAISLSFSPSQCRSTSASRCRAGSCWSASISTRWSSCRSAVLSAEATNRPPRSPRACGPLGGAVSASGSDCRRWTADRPPQPRCPSAPPLPVDLVVGLGDHVLRVVGTEQRRRGGASRCSAARTAGPEPASRSRSARVARRGGRRTAGPAGAGVRSARIAGVHAARWLSHGSLRSRLGAPI